MDCSTVLCAKFKFLAAKIVQKRWRSCQIDLVLFDESHDRVGYRMSRDLRSGKRGANISKSPRCGEFDTEESRYSLLRWSIVRPDKLGLRRTIIPTSVRRHGCNFLDDGDLASLLSMRELR